MVNFRLEGKPDGHHSAMLGRTIAAGIEWIQGAVGASFIWA